MIPNPDHIQYACIAKGTTVLAEFNSRDAALGAIAARCLDNTPSLHATFTHTVRSKTYTFLIDDPFVYFVISDVNLENSEALSFLKSVRGAFSDVVRGKRKLEKLSSHCYQGEFNPVFRQLLGPALYHMDGIGSPMGHRIGLSGFLQSGSGPIRDSRGSKPNGDKGLNKMKNRLFGHLKFGRKNVEKEHDENDGGSGIGLSRELSFFANKSGGSSYSGELKAENVWKRQVWLVLSLDLMFCAMLFVVWLWVCSGFRCMAN